MLRLKVMPKWLKWILLALPVILLAVVMVVKAIWLPLVLKTAGKSLKEERSDILKRRRYLIKRTLVSPQQLIEGMPAVEGHQFQSEWAIYTYAMLSAALTNISYIFPETRLEAIDVIDRLIQNVLSPEMRRYDADKWGEDPLESLDGNNGHISYVSLLAWMISGYKFVGGGNQYDKLFDELCEAMNRRLLLSSSMTALTYPYEPVFMPDLLVAYVALANYAKLNNGKYADTVYKWVEQMKSKFAATESGLLCSAVTHGGVMLPEVRGSYTALNCYYLTYIDEEYAANQYDIFKHTFGQNGLLSSVKEFTSGRHPFEFKIDAGWVIFNLSPTGTAFGIGSATYHRDFKFRKQLLITAELAGSSVVWRGEKHYLLSNLVLVGEAITLAMKTATRWE